MSYYDFDDPVVASLYRARTRLVREQPLLGQVALEMELVVLDEPTDWCPRAATDGRSIYFVRDFVLSLFRDSHDPKKRTFGNDRLVAIVAHEVWHRILGHLLRRGKRDPEYWGMAIDYMVNANVKEDGIGRLPDGALYDGRFTSDMSCEEIYDYLIKANVDKQEPLDRHLEPEMKSGGSGGHEAGMGELENAIETEAFVGDICAREMTSAPQQLSFEEASLLYDRSIMTALDVAEKEGEGAGFMPGSLLRQLEKIKGHEIDWRKILRSKLHSIEPYDYTYDVISEITWATRQFYGKRYFEGCGYPKGFCAITPTLIHGERIEVVIAIDTSASMSAKMISDLLAEVKGILTSFHEVEVTLICFDAGVHAVEKITSQNLSKLETFRTTKVKGGGGTDFMAIWDHLQKEKIKPERLIVCTDGLPCGEWGIPGYCDTLFLIHSKDNRKKIKAPFGETAYLK